MLNDTLSKFKNEKLEIFSEEIKEKLAREQKELLESHIVENTIKVGDMIPDFKVVDAYGEHYTKKSFKNKKLILNFFRGSW